MNNQPHPQGTQVQFHHPLTGTGTGTICGISTTPQPYIRHGYIIQLHRPLPNYPYTHIALNETQFTLTPPTLTPDEIIEQILTPLPDQHRRVDIPPRPNFYYYTVPKTPQDMTPDELVQEIRAAKTAHAIAEENQAGISTKEHVRRQNCELELVTRPNGIDLWNQEFAQE